VRVVFEGLPGAGKTSHVNALAKSLGCPMIAEWVAFPESDWMRYTLREPYYLANDETKEFLGNLFKDSLVLFDRHYTGALAYSYALSVVRHADCSTGECYEQNMSWYRRCMAEHRLSASNVVFWLDISPATSLQRQPRARASDPIWGDVDCLEAMRFYYRQFYALIEPHVKLIHIDAEQPLAQVYHLIETHMKTIV
jgi:thymidylate kinase